MAKTKDDFKKDGAEYARAEAESCEERPTPYPRPKRLNVGWQAQAWWEGYDSWQRSEGIGTPKVIGIDQGSPAGDLCTTVTGRIKSHAADVAWAEETGRAQMRSLRGKSWLSDLGMPVVITINQWPEGAQSHYHKLKSEYYNCREESRRCRLAMAMIRLHKRWNKRVAA